MPDNLAARSKEFEAMRVGLSQTAGLIIEFYNALKDGNLPDEVVHQIVIDYAGWQWVPEGDEDSV